MGWAWLALGGVIEELAKHCIDLMRPILDVFIRILAELHASVPRRELRVRFTDGLCIFLAVAHISKNRL